MRLFAEILVFVNDLDSLRQKLTKDSVLDYMICEAVMNKRSVGSIYEQLAAEQLINMGYSVLACNYRNRLRDRYNSKGWRYNMFL